MKSQQPALPLVPIFLRGDARKGIAVRFSGLGMTRGMTSLCSTVLLGTVILFELPSASAAPPPTGVKTTGRAEIQPAAGQDAFAWSEDSRRRPFRFDLFVKPDSSPRFKVNPRGTQAFAGNIEGSTVVYHQRSRRRKSDIKFPDLVTRARSEPPGVNTKGNFESQGSLSGDWLLFWRQRRSTNSEQKILLRNLVTEEQRLLATGRSPREWTQPGRVSGNFATYTKCRNPSFCNTFRYDIEANETTKIPNPRRKVLAAASVAPDGTIYFAAGDASIFKCEGRTSLWRFTPEGEKVRIASLGPVSVSITSPRTNQDGSTTIFFDAWRRRCRTSDILKVITLP
jgi:hypothetical protein